MKKRNAQARSPRKLSIGKARLRIISPAELLDVNGGAPTPGDSQNSFLEYEY